MKLTKKLALHLLKKMVEIRFFEEKIVDQYARGNVPGLAHLYIGEEAVAVGACTNLNKEDLITSTHRGHGHCIAKGAELKPMMAELFGKKTGYCKGKGGSMHIADTKVGMLGAMGIVGSGAPIAVGAALAAKLRNSGQVVVCFFGDDATNTGAFHESSNFAALHKLPVVFVCENDAYPALDIAGLNRLTYSADVRFVPVRCLGSMNVVWIKDALAKGIDGVFLMGCKHGDDYQCHFVKGSELADIRMDKIGEALKSLALEKERVRQYQIAIDEYDKLPEIINTFVEEIEGFGPNPFKGF